MRHKWLLAVATLALAVVLGLASFSIVYAQPRGANISGNLAVSGRGAAVLKVALDPGEVASPNPPKCQTTGDLGTAVHLKNDCPPPAATPDLCMVAGSQEGPRLSVISKGGATGHECHVDFHVVNDGSVPVMLQTPVIRNSQPSVYSVLINCHGPIFQPIPCGPVVINPGLSHYVGLEVIVRRVPPVTRTLPFAVRLPVTAQP